MLPFDKKNQAKKPKKKEKSSLTRKEERKQEHDDQTYEDSVVYGKVLERSYDWILGANMCELCHSKPAEQMAHIIPRSRGGETTFENIRHLCMKCHFEQDHKLRIIT